MRVFSRVGISAVLAMSVLLGMPTLAHAERWGTATYASGAYTETLTQTNTAPVTVTATTTGATYTNDGGGAVAANNGLTTFPIKAATSTTFTPNVPTGTTVLGFLTGASGCTGTGNTATLRTCANRGTITLTFSRPVTNPRVAIMGLGGSLGSGSTATIFAASGTITSVPAGATMSVGAGAANLSVDGSGTTFATTTTRPGTACDTYPYGTNGPSGCGTLQVTGAGLTSITFAMSILVSGSSFTTLGADTGDHYGVVVSLPDQPMPTADPDTASVVSNATVTISPLTNDTPASGIALTPASTVFTATTGWTLAADGKTLSNATYGTYTMNTDGTVLFDPIDTFTGTVPAVNYRLTDAEGSTAASTITVTVIARPQLVLRKTTIGTDGGPFGFTLTNTVQTSGTVTTSAADTAVQVDGDSGTAGTQAFTINTAEQPVTITESSIPSTWGLASAACTSGGSPVGTLTNGVLTIPGSATIAGATITCDVTNGKPAISLTKTAGAASGATVDSTVPYTFTVTNTGATPLSGIAVTDSKISSVTCVATSLASGASTTCSGIYTLTQADIDAGQVVNNASVTGTPPAGAAVTATATNTKTVPASPSISLTKTAGTPLSNAADASLPYSFTATNTGNVTLTSVSITDSKIASVTCLATTLAPNASTSCSGTYTLTQADVDAGQVVNNATVSASPPSGPAVTATATSTKTITRATTITLSKTAGAPTGMHASDTIPYTFTVTNTGNVTVTAVSITDAQTSGVSCAATTLAPAASTTCTGTHTITQAEMDAGQVVNNASVTAAPPTGMTAPTATATATSTLTRTASVTLDKQFSGTTGWSAGDVVSYSFVVNNAGNVTLTDVAVTDLTVESMSCAATTLAPGASTTCTATHVLTQAEVDAGHLYNSATVSANPPSGMSAASGADSLDTPVVSGPSLTLEKSASAPSVAAAGGVIDYSFLVTNTGNITMSNLNITDARATDLACPVTVLAPGESTTCTGKHVLIQAEVNAGTVTNTATADAISPAGTHAIATDSVTSTIARTSSLTFDKQVGSATGSTPGETVPYTFLVTNTGNVTVNGVTVDDSTLDSATCPATALAPAATMTCTGTYTLTQADIDGGHVANTASATATPPSGVTPPTSNTDSTDATLTRTADLDFTKTAGAPTGNSVGSTITYTFTVTNTGNVTLTEVGVSDPQVGPVTCPETTLAPGASTICTKVYPITQADVDAGGVHNTATATATAPSGVTSPSVDATADSTLTRTASMTMVKQTAGTVPTTAGSDISYEFLVTNTGNVTLTGVSVTDAKVGTVACPSDDLAPGATATCTATYPLTQSDVDAGEVTNTATASATPPTGVTAPSAADAITTDIPASPSIDLVKSAGGITDANASTRDDVGDTITYTFTVTNTGNVTLSGVDVSDPKVGTVTCPDAALAPGASTICTKVYPLLQSDVNAGQVVNNASASGTPPTGSAVSDAATTTTTVGRTATLSFDKQAGTPSGSIVGSTINYTFVVTNTGTVTLTNVGVSDLTIGTVSCPQTTVEPGQSLTCTKLYPITQSDLDTGSVSNNATASGTAPTGMSPASAGDSTTTPLTQNPALSFDKQSGGVTDANASGRTDVGDTITYTFVATNTGNVTLDPVIVHDPMALGSDLDCGSLAVGASKTCGTAVYALTQDDIDAGHVANTASASGLAPDGTTSSPTASDGTDTPVSGTPAISVDKTAGAIADTNTSGRTDVGDTITYTFTATNTGTATLNSVTVTDPKATLNACSLGSLAPGATATCTGTHVLTLGDLNAGTLSNTATVTGTPTNGAAVTGTDTVVTTITQTPALSIVKKADTPESDLGQVGDTIDYSFTVTNTGTVTLTGVGVSDPKVGTVTCPVATLNPGVATTCTASYTLTQDDVDLGSVVNTATATGTAPGGSTLTADSNEVTSDIASAPQVTLAKSAGAIVDANGSGTVDAGDSIDYTFAVTNPGNVSLTSVSVIDPLIPALSCSAASLDTLANDPAAVLTCTETYTLTQDDVNAGTVANTATALGNPPTGDPVDSTSSTTTPITRTASLSFDKQAPASVGSTPGSTATYHFVVANTGNVTITSIVISDDLTGTPSCPSDALAPGASMTCTATHSITQTEIDAGALTNHASVTGTAPVGVDAPTASDDTATGINQNPGITVTKSAGVPSGNVADSSTIDYTFTVKNTGNVTVTDVSVSDPLIPTLACTVASLAPGATTTCTATYTITQSDADARQVTNTATVNATDSAGDPITNTSTAVTTAVPESPAVTMSKSYDSVTDTNGNGVTDAGDEFHYTLTATNTGNVTLDDVTITDTEAVLASCAPVDDVAPGDSTSCTGVHTLTQAEVDSGALANTGDVSATSPGAATVQGADTVTTPIAEAPAMTVAKAAGAASGATAGSTIPYTFTVTNTGNVTLSGIVVTDPKIPGGLSCPTDTLAPAAQMDCTATYSLTQADVDSGSVLNTASVTGDSPQGTETGDSSDPVTSTIPASPAMTLTKKAAAPSGNTVGSTITYTFTVTNTGNVTLNPVTITDPKAVLDASCSTLAPLAPTATTTCTGVHTLTQAEVDAGSVTNTATGNATPPTGDPITTTSNTVTSTISSQPGVAVEKQAGSVVDANTNGLTDAGDTITYTFTVTNTGNVTLNPVTITDPKAVLDASCSTLAPLAPTATTTCTGIHTLTQTEVDAGHSANTATVTATPPTGGPVTGTDSTDTPITSVPGLAMDKAVGPIADPTHLAAGDTITYTFTVSNTGNVTVTLIHVVDDITGNPTCADTTLLPAATTTCTAAYVLTQDDVDSGHIANSATVFGKSPTSELTDAGDSTDTPIPANPGIEIVKTAGTPSAATVGSTIPYTFTVTNTGNVTLSGIVVTDPKITGPITCPTDILAPADTMDCVATYRLTQTDADSGSVTNTATVDGTTPDGDPVTDSSDPVTTTIDSSPSMTVAKTAGAIADANTNNLTDAGDTITYTFTVTNTGNVTLNPVTITDPKAVLDASCSTLAPLAPTATTTCTGVHTLTQAEVDAGSVTNTATGNATPPTGDPITTTSNTVTSSVSADPSLTLIKAAGTPSGNTAGSNVEYTFTVTNTGNVTLANVTVTDPLIPALSCSDTQLSPGEELTCTATYQFTQADVDAGGVHNTAAVTAAPPTGSSVSANADADVTIAANAGIDLAKTGAHEGVTAGSAVNYSFVVTNTGNVTVSNVVIDDPSLSSVSCPATTLAPAASITCTGSYLLSQADIDAGSVHNDASVSATTPAGGTLGATDGTDVQIAAGPSLDLLKTAGAIADTDGNGVDAGDGLEYIFTVTNTGNVTLANVTVTDPLITSVSCPITTVKPGSSVACTGTYRLTQEDLDRGTITNVATATAATGADGSTTVATGSDVVTSPLSQTPAIAIKKTSDASGVLIEGTLLHFSFNVANTGNVTLTDVSVDDPMLSAVSCPATTLAPGASMICTGAPYSATASDARAGKIVNTASSAAHVCPPTGCVVLSARDTVAVAVTKPADDSLAFTGASVGMSLAVGGGILAFGILLVVVVRRRRADAQD